MDMGLAALTEKSKQWAKYLNTHTFRHYGRMHADRGGLLDLGWLFSVSPRLRIMASVVWWIVVGTPTMSTRVQKNPSEKAKNGSRKQPKIQKKKENNLLSEWSAFAFYLTTADITSSSGHKVAGEVTIR
ncbi:hypothetical protein JTE90_010663 [Oedothorax gibbosus]|uniref:Uncharacterized protein n=1 Tax=Oedothorax gibbosus TaxID=931172 RepID=A0AAV6URN3_9ARAC|nr:hypothetical protein JTE90_010663 [Oedothorax gibbosus]